MDRNYSARSLTRLKKKQVILVTLVALRVYGEVPRNPTEVQAMTFCSIIFQAKQGRSQIVRFLTVSTDSSHVALHDLSPALSITTNTGKQSKILCCIYFKINKRMATPINHPPSEKTTVRPTDQPTKIIAHAATERASERPNSNISYRIASRIAAVEPVCAPHEESIQKDTTLE